MDKQRPACLFGSDLKGKRQKITKTHTLAPVLSLEDVPVVIPHPNYFAIGSSDKPAGYFKDKEVLVEYQVRGMEWHLKNIPDDYVPYIMPWHGTGIVPSMFGAEIHYPDNKADDPSIKGPCLSSIDDIAKLKVPNPYKDGLMPLVLDIMDYAVKYTDSPVGLTDMQSPLDCATLMAGHSNLCLWMYDDPAAVKALFDIITETIIVNVKAQKKVTGDSLEENQGLQGVWAPKGIGIWLSDDDAVLLSPEFYEQFEVPAVSRIFKTFGKGILHYCGDNTNKLKIFKKIENLAAINTCCMGDFKLIKDIQEVFEYKLPVIMQESAPLDIAYYYDHLFAELKNMNGIISAPWVTEDIVLKRDGGTTSVFRDPLVAAKEIVARVRRNTKLMLERKSTLLASYPVLPGDGVKNT